LTNIYKIDNWWHKLSEETKIEIFENNYGVDYGSNNWRKWWNFISDKEKIQIYEDFNLNPEEEDLEDIPDDDVPDDEKNFYRKGGYER